MSKIDWTADAIITRLTDLGVNQNRLTAMEQKFVTVPDSGEFIDIGVVDITIDKGKPTEKILPKQPCVFLNTDKTKYLLFGYLSAKYTDRAENPSQITKVGENKDAYLVVNNKAVQPFAEGLSEAETVASIMGKSFKASKPKDFLQFSPTFTDGKVSFFKTAKEATDACKTKSYRILNLQ